MAEVALSGGLDTGHAGERYQVVLHVERAASEAAPVAAAATQPGDGVLEVDGAAVRVSAETSRRLCCDANLVTMHHDSEGRALEVGRRTRTIPIAIRRALSARDTHCQFPGCSARRCDVHHIHHWMDGGPTCVDNLVRLCRRHHRLVHEGGLTLRWRQDETVSVIDRHGREIPAAPPLPAVDMVRALTGTTARRAVEGVVITARTLPTWDGTPLDVACPRPAVHAAGTASILTGLSGSSSRAPVGDLVWGRGSLADRGARENPAASPTFPRIGVCWRSLPVPAAPEPRHAICCLQENRSTR